MKYFLMLTAVFFCLLVKAQENPMQDSVLVQIETKDGNIFVGSILQEDESKIILRTNNLGEIVIQKASIRTRSIVKETQMIEGEFWFQNPHSTRYFWGPSGYGLKTGEAYYQNTWVMFNQVSVGINDHFSMGVGTLPIFLFGAGVIPIWITPKVSYEIKKDKWNVGGGVLAATVIGESDGGAAGIVYGVSTRGSKDHNVTLGVGYGFTPNGWGTMPTFTLSGMTRITRKGYFLTENYFISDGSEYVGILAFGFRSVGKRLAIDFGGFTPVGTGEGVILIPWLGVNIPFGRLPE